MFDTETIDFYNETSNRLSFIKKLTMATSLAIVLNVAPAAVKVVNAGEMKMEASAAVFNKDGSLKRPTGYREWIYVGTPLTPNDMNDGKAAFPEFHNVYIDPASWTYWKKNGEFRDGTILVKELVSVGSKSAASGKGYFEGEFLGLEATVKDKKHFASAPGNWAYFRFTNEDFKGLKSNATAQPVASCSSCHQPNAQQDFVFTQYYPVLRAGKASGQIGSGGL
ncbi:MAG: cytochrome P460 family protein [Methylophilaceae bacterium]